MPPSGKNDEEILELIRQAAYMLSKNVVVIDRDEDDEEDEDEKDADEDDDDERRIEVNDDLDVDNPSSELTGIEDEKEIKVEGFLKEEIIKKVTDNKWKSFKPAVWYAWCEFGAPSTASNLGDSC